MMTKLHLILVFTVVSVAFYMYFLYKEIKVFQNEVMTIKKQVHAILTSQPLEAQVCPVSAPSQAPEEPLPEQFEQIETDDNLVLNNDDDEDDGEVSVTSNDIKEILTNIQDTEPDAAPATAAPVVQAETKVMDDLSQMNQEQLTCYTYNQLRDWLRSNGQPAKGSKQNLIDKVLTMSPNKIQE